MKRLTAFAVLALVCAALAGCTMQASNEDVSSASQALSKTMQPNAGDFDTLYGQQFVYCSTGTSRATRGNCAFQSAPYFGLITCNGCTNDWAGYGQVWSGQTGEYRAKLGSNLVGSPLCSSITAIDDLTITYTVSSGSQSVPVRFISMDSQGRGGSQAAFTLLPNQDMVTVPVVISANPAVGVPWTKQDFGCGQSNPPAVGWWVPTAIGAGGYLEVDSFTTVLHYH